VVVNPIEVEGFRVALYLWGFLAALEAAMTADRLNRGEAVGQWELF
jgi:hypothetical protein